MEKLHENPFVVNELERILKEDYPFLEYSDQVSKKLSEDFLERVRDDELYVRVKPKMERTERDGSVIKDISDKLSQAINVPLMSEVCPPARCYKSGSDSSRQNRDRVDCVSFIQSNDKPRPQHSRRRASVYRYTGADKVAD